MTTRKSSADGGVRSVRLALDVLETIAFSGEELGVTQLADRLSVTKGSIHRHLLTLVERGYLAQNSVTTRYGLGPKSRLLARLAPDADLVQLAEGPMRELRDELGFSVVLSAMSQRGALVLLTISGTSPIEIGVRIGSELPFNASAQGKILLAYAPKPLQQRVLTRHFTALTPKTITSRDGIERDLEAILKNGWTGAPEEALLGINAIAAPIFDERDNCIASLAIVGSIQFLPAMPSRTIVAALKYCAKAISKRLGHGTDVSTNLATASLVADRTPPSRRRI